MKKIILACLLSINICMATQLLVTTDTAKSKMVSNYIKKIYDLDTILFNAGDIAMMDILFIQKLKEHNFCTTDCTPSDFNITIEDTHNAISAYYNYETDKNLTDMNFTSWKNKKHLTNEGMLQYIYDKITRIRLALVDDDISGTKSFSVYYHEPTSSIESSVTIVFLDDWILRIKQDSFKANYAMSMDQNFQDKSKSIYTINDYACKINKFNCLVPSEGFLANPDLLKHTSIQITTDPDGNVTEYSGALYYMSNLVSYWEGQKNAMENMSDQTLTDGDFVLFGYDSDKLGIDW